ncbi:hypothetical protein EMIT0194P_70082 [Pseudomonas serbica]
MMKLLGYLRMVQPWFSKITHRSII